MTSEDDRYWCFVDELILRAGEASSLAELCRQLPGVYPTDVRERVRILGDSRRLARAAVERLCEHQADERRRPLEVFSSVLPMPHPLDYEWRFTRRAVHDLVELAGADHEAGSIALLGTPYVAEVLAAEARADRAVLFERRAEACDPLRDIGVAVAHGDVAAAPEHYAETFDLAIADPPWYPAVCERFVHAAAGLLRRGGRLVMSGPGLGTRPSIAAERHALFAFAHIHGLVLTEMRPTTLRYESPPFELVALASAGLDGFACDWRTADLFVFTKVAERGSFAPDADAAGGVVWDEVTYGQTRVRVRPSVAADKECLRPLEPIGCNGVMPTVSRRAPGREDVQVWTTTNGVYRTSDPPRLLASIRAATTHDTSTKDEFETAALSLLEVEEQRLQHLGALPAAL